MSSPSGREFPLQLLTSRAVPSLYATSYLTRRAVLSHVIKSLAAAGGYTVNGALDAAAAMQKVLPLKPGSSSTTGTLSSELTFEDAQRLTC